MTAKILVQIVLMVLGFTVLPVYSQVTFGHYDIDDLLSGTRKKETWFAAQNKKTPGIYFSERVSNETSKKSTSEIIDVTKVLWSRKFETINSEILNKDIHADVYYEEVLATLPLVLESSETTYGYINVRNKKTHEIIEAWPLFLEMQRVAQSWKATYTAYLSNNRRMEIVRVFLDEGYFFPSEEEVKIYKPGIIASLVPKNTEPSRFLDMYTIARRKD